MKMFARRLLLRRPLLVMPCPRPSPCHRPAHLPPQLVVSPHPPLLLSLLSLPPRPLSRSRSLLYHRRPPLLSLPVRLPFPLPPPWHHLTLPYCHRLFQRRFRRRRCRLSH